MPCGCPNQKFENLELRKLVLSLILIFLFLAVRDTAVGMSLVPGACTWGLGAVSLLIYICAICMITVWLANKNNGEVGGLNVDVRPPTRRSGSGDNSGSGKLGLASRRHNRRHFRGTSSFTSYRSVPYPEINQVIGVLLPAKAYTLHKPKIIIIIIHFKV